MAWSKWLASAASASASATEAIPPARQVFGVSSVGLTITPGPGTYKQPSPFDKFTRISLIGKSKRLPYALVHKLKPIKLQGVPSDEQAKGLNEPPQDQDGDQDPSDLEAPKDRKAQPAVNEPKDESGVNDPNDPSAAKSGKQDDSSAPAEGQS